MFGCKTREEFVRGLCEGDRKSHDRAQLDRLLDARLGKRDPRDTFSRDDKVMSLDDLWNLITDCGFLYEGGKWGWITPEGEFLTCGYASHDRLLLMLDIEIEDAEDLGWVRVSMATIQNKYRLTGQQRRALRDLDRLKEVDLSEEIMKKRAPRSDG